MPEILYGGARGGGKTDGVIGRNAIKAELHGRAQKAVFFRRELPQLEHAIERTKEIYLPLGWKWGEQKKMFTSPRGATLRFRPLERDVDAIKYIGQDFTDLYFEELTNWPSPVPIDKMRGVLRSATGVPCSMIATTNPGGPGHTWVKARYVDPAPPNTEFDGKIFIPAKVSDNQILLKNDPEYTERLKMAGSDALVRAWLDGDWNIVEGAFFDCWSQDIVIDPFEIPEDWTRFRSFDWGSARPFSVGWWTVVGQDYIHHGQRLPRGALVRYREWYGASRPNVGLKLTAEQVGRGIVDREEIKERIAYSVADPAIFAEDGGPSIAHRMRPVFFRKADNRRVAKRGAAGGWDQLRARMVGEDGRPMIYCFKTCTDSIRTIPALQHDMHRAEDLDTSAEDHAADEWRYACMSRPYVSSAPVFEPPPTDVWGRVIEMNSWKVQ